MKIRQCPGCPGGHVVHQHWAAGALEHYVEIEADDMISNRKGRPYGPGTLQVWDDPDRSRGVGMGRVVVYLVLLAALAALVAALASRATS